jgi:hypothetical protein
MVKALVPFLGTRDKFATVDFWEFANLLLCSFLLWQGMRCHLMVLVCVCACFSL